MPSTRFRTVLLKALTHLNGFRGHSSFQTWLLRIISNAALDVGRQRCASAVPQAPATDPPERFGNRRSAWSRLGTRPFGPAAEDRRGSEALPRGPAADVRSTRGRRFVVPPGGRGHGDFHRDRDEPPVLRRDRNSRHYWPTRDSHERTCGNDFPRASWRLTSMENWTSRAARRRRAVAGGSSRVRGIAERPA